MECQTRPTTKCVLCLRPAEKLSTENRCWQQQIADVYITYLKPKLSTTAFSINWVSLLKGSTLNYCQFCSDCLSTGQKLTSMNVRLIALQCAIQDFVGHLSEQILKYRNELDPSSNDPIDFVSPYLEQFSENSDHEIEIKTEDEIIKVEVEEVESIYMEDISNHTFINSQDPLENQTDTQDPLEDHFDSNDAADDDYYQDECINDQDSSEITRETSGLSNHEEILPIEKIKTTSKFRTHVVKHLRSRKIVDLVPRLEEGSKTKIANRKRKSNKNKSTNLYNTRARKQSFTHVLEEDDFDIHGNQIKRVPKETEEKNYESDSDELDDAIEQQVSRNLSATNISSNAFQEHRNLHCTLCDANFQKLSTFEKHMFKKHRRTPAQCSKCDQIFIDREARGIHMKSVHPTTKSLLCAACPDLEKFPNLYEYEVHTLSHTDEIPYDCPNCHEKFSNCKSYCEHQKTSSCANLGGQFACEKCDEVFKAKCLLLTHIIVLHNKKKKDQRHILLQCEMCKKPPMRRFNLEEHYASEHTEEFIIPCDICGMSLQNTVQFDEHRKSHRSKVKIPCHLCDKTFNNLPQLRYHIRLTHTEGVEVKVTHREYICEHCGIKFGKVERYRYHLKICNKSYVCDMCGKKFKHPTTHKLHMKGHTDGFPTCTICNSQFDTDARLKKHVDITHLKKQTVICELCGKTLISNGSLQIHIREQHSTPTSYDCETCGEKFSNTYKRNRHHRLVHLGELVSCQYCSEMFPTREAQRSHEDTKHWEVRNKDFKCTACEAVFKQKRQRSKHRKLMHPDLVTCSVNKQCQLCNKLFHSGDALKTHMRRHERDKDGSFQCELCSRTFVKQQSLTWHMSQDHNIKRNL